MALVSNIVVDLVNKTIILSCSVDSNPVETITYDKATNTVTFDSRDDIIINFSDFLDFCNQVNIYQTSILFNFPSIDVFSTTPFVQIMTNELHDPGQWNLTISAHTDPTLIEYEGTRSSQKLYMLPRAGSKTLEFPEWEYVLTQLNHYKLSIKGF